MNAQDEIEILTRIKHIEVELSELKASLSLPQELKKNSMSLKEFYKNTVIELIGNKYWNNQAVIDKYLKLYADEVMKEAAKIDMPKNLGETKIVKITYER
jgi:hypothetical protein